MAIIECKGLVKKYGARSVLNQLDFTVEPGEMVAVMGKSGCGKTTLLNILGLVDGYDAGNYQIMGHQNVKVRSKEAMALSKNRINCIFQKNHLMDKETVFNNLKTVLHSSDMPKDKQDEAIAKMLKDMTVRERNAGIRVRIYFFHRCHGSAHAFFSFKGKGQRYKRNGQRMQLSGKLCKYRKCSTRTAPKTGT